MSNNNLEEVKMNILVVDDAKIVLSFYQKGLSKIGHCVHVVENAVKALEMITTNDYDIVISDINMELMDGLELLEVIKRDYPHIEVIMMTGYATVENAIEAMKKGAYDFLLKPVKLDQVRLVVSNCVEKIQMSHEVKQLREVNEKLKEVKQLKERFIAITSHELRTPVSHIKSYLDFLEDPDFPEEEKKMFFDIVKKSVLDLERIVTGMFEVSQVENRQLTLNMEPIKLNEIVRDCLQQFSVDLMKRELTIDHDETPEIPNMSLDPFQFKKVIMEILNNSIRFTADGGSINIFYKVSDNVLKIVIKDTGIGIPADKIGTIFEKFYEVQDSSYHTSSKIDFMGGSTGIGLPLAKGLVEAHGGRMKVDSKEGEGTTVSIYLKRKDDDQSPINAYEKMSPDYSQAF